MIRAICFNNSAEYVDKNRKPLFALNCLSRFNILIGENNSGKSRLSRRIINEKGCHLIDGDIRSENINSLSVRLNNIDALYQRICRISVSDRPEIDINAARTFLKASDGYGLYFALSEPINDWLSSDSIKNSENQQLNNIKNELFSDLQQIILLLSGVGQVPIDRYDSINALANKCFYIPVLRGIENFDAYFDKEILKPVNDALLNRDQWRAVDEYAKSSEHIYEDKISKTYKIDKSFIFTAENLYDDVKSKLLGSEDDRSRVKDFQDFISNTFYSGNGFTIYPRENKYGSGGYLAVKIGTSRERAIYDLGDGIKQMITILYKMYEQRDNEAVFIIEEPELNLHPGLQKKLMRIIQSDTFEKHQFLSLLILIMSLKVLLAPIQALYIKLKIFRSIIISFR